MRPTSDGALSPNPHYYKLEGRAAEIARALGSPVGGAEHGPLSTDRAATIEVLNSALASLNRPLLDA
ncbi:MAG TPA: hypothetical protein VN969_37555 [Streptosporangiaceae bacterium]|jgi:hypothetical protein|nr:hypothetical protein [Streptosporangiaceae bacterium]